MKSPYFKEFLEEFFADKELDMEVRDQTIKRFLRGYKAIKKEQSKEIELKSQKERGIRP